MDLKLIIETQYVKNSTYREKAIKAIGSEIKTPTQIGRESNIRINHISNTLGQLKTKNIVECINEDAKKGRLYKLTQKGFKIYNFMEGKNK